MREFILKIWKHCFAANSSPLSTRKVVARFGGLVLFCFCYSLQDFIKVEEGFKSKVQVLTVLHFSWSFINKKCQNALLWWFTEERKEEKPGEVGPLWSTFWALTKKHTSCKCAKMLNRGKNVFLQVKCLQCFRRSFFNPRTTSLQGTLSLLAITHSSGKTCSHFPR